MKIKYPIFWASSFSFFILLLGLYSSIKFIIGCKYCFSFMFPFMGGSIPYIDTYLYQYTIGISLIFGSIISKFIKYYSKQKTKKRIFINLFVIQLLTLLIGGFFSGFLYGIHDMYAGFYLSFDHLMSNCFQDGFLSALMGGYIILSSLPLFGILMLVASFFLVETLRVLYLNKLQQDD
jgi:hypothetical protein